jgi:predicted unusual protein kinase regulating ubiquinone biosynthesis (AarF/ABC1/UbiB family)
LPGVADDEQDGHAGAEPFGELGAILEGGVRRGLRLGAALVGAVGRSAGRRWLNGGSDAEPAGDDGAKLALVLGNLKGLSMKLGQMLSYVDFQTPSTWTNALSVLQHHSAAMPRDVVFRVVQEDLGHPPDVLFSAWEAKPIAAASIGQVHRARLRNGTEVAVKVRYPEIERVVRQDLSNLSLLRRLGNVFATQLDTDALMQELRERFLEECDYRKEAESQAAFRKFFADDASVVVPEPFLEHSSERVLTMAYVEGRRFDEFSQTASQGERDLAARSIHNFAFNSIFRLGALNCDPHPGNYLFLSGAVAFLDFGCVRRFPAEFVRTWKIMLRSALEQDRESFDEAVVRIGLAGDRGSFDFDAHYAQYLYLIHPWLTEDALSMTPEFVARTYRALLRSNTNRSQLRMPRELLFANRLQWGLYSVLSRLGSTVSLRNEILDILYDHGEPRPAPYTYGELRRHIPDVGSK